MYIYGNMVTNCQPSSNNMKENDGNLNLMQSICKGGTLYSLVSSDAIRFAIRNKFLEVIQKNDIKTVDIDGKKYKIDVNKTYDMNSHSYSYKQNDFNDTISLIVKDTTDTLNYFVDDDVMGYMTTKGSEKGERGSCSKRTSSLKVNNFVSLTPFERNILGHFATAGGTPGKNKSADSNENCVPHSEEVHFTSYQMPFALNENDYIGGKMITDIILDIFCDFPAVGGKHSRFLYDFSPIVVVIRKTKDMSSKIQYCILEKDDGSLCFNDTTYNKIKYGDINKEELFIGSNVNSIYDIAKNDLKLPKDNISKSIREIFNKVKNK